MPSVSASMASQPQQSVDFPINSKFVFDKGTAAYILSIELQVMVIVVTWRVHLSPMIRCLWSYQIAFKCSAPIHHLFTMHLFVLPPLVSHIISSTLSITLTLSLTHHHRHHHYLHSPVHSIWLTPHHIASYLTISHHVMVSWVIPMIPASHWYRHFTKSRLFGPRWYRGNRHSRWTHPHSLDLTLTSSLPPRRSVAYLYSVGCPRSFFDPSLFDLSHFKHPLLLVVSVTPPHMLSQSSGDESPNKFVAAFRYVTTLFTPLWLYAMRYCLLTRHQPLDESHIFIAFFDELCGHY